MGGTCPHQPAGGLSLADSFPLLMADSAFVGRSVLRTFWAQGLVEETCSSSTQMSAPLGCLPPHHRLVGGPSSVPLPHGPQATAGPLLTGIYPLSLPLAAPFCLPSPWSRWDLPLPLNPFTPDTDSEAQSFVRGHPRTSTPGGGALRVTTDALPRWRRAASLTFCARNTISARTARAKPGHS